MCKFLMKAFAEVSESARYNKAVANQYAQQYGVSTRQAKRAVSTMANNRAPFQPSRGVNASGNSVLRQARRLAR